jgi:peptide/nickel transport system substrate-binding protein
MVQDLMTGQLDAVNRVNSTLAGSLEDDPAIEVRHTVSDWWLNFAFNFGKGTEPTNLPAIGDLTLRQAVAHAIDRDALVERVYPLTGAPGDSVIRPASTRWHLDIPAEDEFVYDPDLARSMLEDAGYVDGDGDGIREDPATGDALILQVPVSKATPGAVEASQMLVDWLGAVGIRMETEVVSEGRMNDHWGKGDYDAYIWYWSGDPDPDFQLSVFTTGQCGADGWSDGCFSDATFDGLYDEQRTVLDPEARREVVYEAQRYLYDQIPGFVLAYPGSSQAYRTDRIEGWTASPNPDGYVVYGYGVYEYLPLRLKEDAATVSSTGLPIGVWGAASILVGVVVVIGVTVSRRRRRDEA